jgi:hypothetical protein
MSGLKGLGLAALALAVAVLLNASRLEEWWRNRRVVGSDCLFVAHSDADSLCVVVMDLGVQISQEEWNSGKASPPLFCGPPIQAAEFVQKSGHRICLQTAITTPPRQAGVITWLRKTRDAESDCFFVVHADAEKLCVVTRDLGSGILPEDWKTIRRFSPPLFCGPPLEAAEFVQKAGRRICQHTPISDSAKGFPLPF